MFRPSIQGASNKKFNPLGDVIKSCRISLDLETLDTSTKPQRISEIKREVNIQPHIFLAIPA